MDTAVRAKTSFSQPAKSLADIKDDCIVVLDTNVLLAPYSISLQNTKKILDIYTNLVSKKRLCIPEQVVKEFDKNRITKLTELVAYIEKKRDALQGNYQGRSLLLESLPVYQEMIRVEKKMDELQKNYRKCTAEVLAALGLWNEGDPLTIRYQIIFEQVIFEIQFSEENLLHEFNERKALHIPPGYKDASKSDGGIGDYKIWRAILEIGKIKKSHVIFVTEEEKADWWHKAQRRALYPRQELVKEFKEYSGGFSFYMTTFSRLLDLFGASESLLTEVHIGEISTRELEILALVQHGLSNEKIASELKLGEGTVRNYLSSAYKKLNVNNRSGAIQKGVEYGLLKPPPPSKTRSKPVLTTQEIRALSLVQQGHDNKKIAEIMQLGHGTVRNYLMSAQKILKANNRIHAVQKAVEYGILFPI